MANADEPFRLPLKLDRVDRSAIYDGRGVHVATTDPSSPEFRTARAAFIVTACNAHAGLVAALREWLALTDKMAALHPTRDLREVLPDPAGLAVRIRVILAAATHTE